MGELESINNSLKQEKEDEKRKLINQIEEIKEINDNLHGVNSRLKTDYEDIANNINNYNNDVNKSRENDKSLSISKNNKTIKKEQIGNINNQHPKQPQPNEDEEYIDNKNINKQINIDKEYVIKPIQFFIT